MTGSRAEYGIARPILERILADERLRLVLFATGSHLSTEHGATVNDIEADGFTIDERVEMPLADDTPAAAGAAVGKAVTGFARALSRRRPDLLLVLGDRYEMLAAAVAALPLTIPLAHVHGGEITEGAIDDAIRHAITKLSHLHFASTEEYARRVVQLGEEPWRVTVSGAPGLDNVRLLDLDGAGPDVDDPFLLVTWHPVTLEPDAAQEQLDEVLAALTETGLGIAFTHPNADPGRRAIVAAIERFSSSHDGVRVFVNLGTRDYFALMRRAAAMVGNSSSGIVEAASFRLPVVDIGSRQRGRIRGANVLHTDPERSAIAACIRRAVSPGFGAGLTGLVNPYGDGHAAERIVERLATVTLGGELMLKRFHEAT